MKIRLGSVAGEGIVPSVNVGSAESVKPIKMLYLLIEAEVETKVNLLIGEEVKEIVVSGDLGGI